ncbi:MAG: penicillin-binding transpeptidase domain-containing protein [bacterium]
MLRRFYIKWKRQSSKKYNLELSPDEVLLDSKNLPGHDMDQFEGQIEKPISVKSLWVVGSFFIMLFLIFGAKIWSLQITNGQKYAERSENNRLRETLVFPERGLIYDRNGKVLAENVPAGSNSEYPLRKYIQMPGISSLLGYVKYPKKDKFGFFYDETLDGKDGIEKFYNNSLDGENGKRIVEVNAVGEVQSESVMISPKNGDNLKLTIDADIQSKMYEVMDELTQRIGFGGGSGVIMDVKTGGLLALVNYPEYSSQVMTDGKDNSKISGYLNSKMKPFLNRAVDGLYTPGSIVKPFMALAGVTENVFDPALKIYSSGALVIPNPYDKTKPSIFRDWKAHGWIDMRNAIAQSSDEYFYRLGGGFPPESQVGLGIVRIDKYLSMFGFGKPLIAGSYFDGVSGVIPTPAWKAENFKDGTWRLGDTYHTSIGQYGFLTNPIQVTRAVSAIANDGIIVEPKLLETEETVTSKVDDVSSYAFRVVKEGMRLAVTDQVEGTAKALYIPEVTAAGKTGTAEIDEGKIKVNSWVIGFFPYEKPRYVFTIMMEKGPRSNTIGASYVMRSVLQWMAVYKSEYFKNIE